LERVQRRALRLICAAFKTSPINAMEIEASIPPIRLAMDAGNRRAALRFNKLSINSPIIQRLPDNWRTGSLPSTGAGVVIYYEAQEVHTQSIGLGKRAEVYDAELMGLYLGACKAVALAEMNEDIAHILFFADNTAAITTIFDPKP
ncbi:hypothetical protein B0H17DRAFT_894633, partial [Mycena rosella]